jgi:hypothetical protein
MREEQTTVSTLFGEEEIKNEDTQPKSSFSVWNFINDISFNKNYLLDETTERMYTPWTVNKNFASHIDTFNAAEFLNRNHHLDLKMQHDYMFYSVQAKKNRWKAWLKKTDAEKKEHKILEDVANVLNYNMQKTLQFWKMLSPKQRKSFIETYVYPDMKNAKK